jgi:hypothetical protein
MSVALKRAEYDSPGQSKGEARSAALGHGLPTKGTLKGCNAPTVRIVAPIQGAEDSLGLQPRATLWGRAPSLCPGLACGSPSGLIWPQAPTL